MGLGSKQVHVSVHDASPANREELEEIHGLLTGLGVEGYSMLVIPDYHGEHPLDRAPEFCEWLKGKREEGVEMVLHGFTHLHSGRPSSPLDRIRSAMFTRGEGEFLELDMEAATDLLRRGRTVLQEAVGVPVDSFVAPAWLYGKGTMEALASEGFRYAENRLRQWNPLAGKTILRSPVVNFAGGGAFKRAMASAWVHTALVLMRRAGTVRFALHPCDLERRAAVLKVLGTLLAYRSSVPIRPAHRTPIQSN